MRVGICGVDVVVRECVRELTSVSKEFVVLDVVDLMNGAGKLPIKSIQRLVR